MKKNYVSFFFFFIIFNVYSQHAPVFDPIPDIAIGEGEATVIPISCSDPDDAGIVKNPSIVVLGSSTAVGYKATEGNSWYDLINKFLSHRLDNYTLTKKAIGGHTSYHIMPSGFVPPPNRPLPRDGYNITTAISLNPDLIIVNLPSNDVGEDYSMNETFNNFRTVDSLARSNGVDILFTTTQPRNFKEYNKRHELAAKADSIMKIFPDNHINIYPDLTGADYYIKPEYNADQIHVNDGGHHVIYEHVKKALYGRVLPDSVRITFSGLPDFVSIQQNDNNSLNLIVEPDFEDAGSYAATAIASDSRGNSTRTDLSITIIDREQLGGRQFLKSFPHTVNNGGTLEYFIYYPPGYDRRPTNQPVLIALHGNAERGGEATRMTGEDGEGSIVKMAYEGADFPLIVVSPHQTPRIGDRINENWSIPVLKQLVDHLINDYQVDSDRIFMTGFSGGGQAVWQYAAAYPDDLAAMTVLAGLTDLTRQSYNVNLQNAPYPCMVKDILAKVYHGTNDVKVNKSHSVNMVEAINACYPDIPAELNLLEGVDHDALRGLVYSNISGPGNMYDWFLSVNQGTPVQDTIPPSFINNTPALTGVEPTTIQVKAEINEPGKIFLAVYPRNSNPSIDEIISGSGTGINYLSYSGLATTFRVERLTSSKPYDIYIIAQDNAEQPNRQSTYVRLQATTASVADTAPPVFDVDPYISRPDAGKVAVLIDLDEPATLYWSLSATASNPTFEQVKTGFLAMNHGSLKVSASAEQLEIAGLVGNTDYFLCLAAEDEHQNRAGNPFQLYFKTLSSASGTVPEQTFKINAVPPGAAEVAGWNNLTMGSLQGKATGFSALRDEQGAPIGPSLTVYHGMNGSSVNGIADNQNKLANGIFPDPVIRHTLYTSSSAKFSLDNLAPEKLYSLTIHGGRAASGSRITAYEIQNIVKTLDAANNRSDIVFFDKLKPDGDGRLMIEFRGVNTSWAYFNALVVDVYVDASGDTVAPAAPSGLSYVLNDSTIELKWTGNSDDDLYGYNIYKSRDNIFDKTSILCAGVQTNYILDALPSDPEVFFRVSAVDQNGNESPLSESILILLDEDSVAPVKPEIISFETNRQAVSIMWQRNPESDLAGYRVYKDAVANFDIQPGKLIAEVNEMEYNDAMVQDNTAFYYKITAVDRRGNESEPSDEIKIQIPDYTAPEKPAGLVVVYVNLDEVRLVWAVNGEEDLLGYRVYRNLIGAFERKDQDRVADSVSGNAFTDRNLSENIEYFYCVTAIDSAGNESLFSSILKIKTPDQTAPSPPDSLFVAENGNGFIRLRWKAVPEEDLSGYRVYRSEIANDEYILLGESPAHSYVDDQVMPGISYNYTVTSVDSSNNESQPSRYIVVTTKDVDKESPSPPENPSAIAWTGRAAVKVVWDPHIENDIIFNIYRDTTEFYVLSSSNFIASLSENYFTDSLLVEGRTYYYRITAVDSVLNESGPSVTIGAYVEDITPPNPPAGISGIFSPSEQNYLIDWFDSPGEGVIMYKLYRGQTNDPDLILNNLAADSLMVSEYLDNDIEPAIYYYIITAVDASGNESKPSDVFTAVIHSQHAGPVLESRIRLNITKGNVSSGLEDWNDIALDFSGTEKRFTNLSDTSGAVSDIILTAFNKRNGSTIVNVADNGGALTNGIFPDPTLRYSAYTTGKIVLHLENLHPDKRYTVILYGGRSGSGSRITNYRVNNEVKSLQCVNNVSQTAVFERVSPDFENKIALEIEKGNVWGYVNAIVVEAYDDSGNRNARRSESVAMESDAGLYVYPNPAGDGPATIRLPDDAGLKLLELRDLKGRLILSRGLGNEREEVIDSRTLNPGAYIIHLYGSGVHHRVKMIIN